MQIGEGSKVAHFDIGSLLGKGGMGEVWFATDTRLGREVAIKVLPEEFTADADRLARFEREARLLAALDHPNIAAIFGIEEVDGCRLLVMQLAEGEDLEERLRQGAIPVDDAIRMATQIAQALEVAHEKGIIHRDLKPANVKVDQDGHIRVLDFGLAKALETDPGDSDVTNSPTIVRAATHAGVIIGTAAYMSPEQARGRKVDRRADVWAFGVLLWEMLTGQRMFIGETVSDTLAAVLTKQPDFSALPPETPPHVRWLLERCLGRDAKKRLRDIGEARVLLAEPEMFSRSTAEVHFGSTKGVPAHWKWIAAALLIGVLGLAGGLFLRSPAPADPLYVRVPLPPDTRLALTGIQPGPPAISPDGKKIAFAADGAPGERNLCQSAVAIGELRECLAPRPTVLPAQALRRLVKLPEHELDQVIQSRSYDLELSSGMFPASRFGRHDRLHHLAKRFPSQIDLTDEHLPRLVRRSSGIGHESPVARARLAAVAGAELRERTLRLEPGGRLRQPGSRAVIAPLPVACMFDGVAAYRVQNDIPRQLQ